MSTVLSLLPFVFSVIAIAASIASSVELNSYLRQRQRRAAHLGSERAPLESPDPDKYEFDNDLSDMAAVLDANVQCCQSSENTQHSRRGVPHTVRIQFDCDDASRLFARIEEIAAQGGLTSDALDLLFGRNGKKPFTLSVYAGRDPGGAVVLSLILNPSLTLFAHAPELLCWSPAPNLDGVS